MKEEDLEIYFVDMWGMIKNAKKVKLVAIALLLDIDPRPKKSLLIRNILTAIDNYYITDYEHDMELNKSIYKILIR